MPTVKKDLSTNISKKLGVTQKVSNELVNSFFSFLKKNHTNKINIHKFGSFSFKITPERVGRNPKTLQEFRINARKKMTFKPSEEFKNYIN